MTAILLYMDWKAIKRRMKEVATWHGLSLVQACEMADIGRNTAYNLRNPRLNTIEKFAQATYTDPKWLLFGANGVPGEKPVKGDFEPIRQCIPLTQNTGSQIDLAIQRWGDWDRKNFSVFLYDMQRLGLYDKLMFFDRKRGKFVYRYVGGFFLQTLGDYITYAPGRALGEVDSDKRFALWCADAYKEALDMKQPLREVCDVVSFYTGEPRRFTYDRVLLPASNSIVIMISQVMEFPGLAVPPGDPSNKGSCPNVAKKHSALFAETLGTA